MTGISQTEAAVQSSSRRTSASFRPDTARERLLTTMRVPDFLALMKLFAENDMWDEIEAELASQHCRNLRISADPLLLTGALLRRKLERGDLPVDTPERYALCCFDTPKSKKPPQSGEVLPPGSSEGGDAGAGNAG